MAVEIVLFARVPAEIPTAEHQLLNSMWILNHQLWLELRGKLKLPEGIVATIQEMIAEIRPWGPKVHDRPLMLQLKWENTKIGTRSGRRVQSWTHPQSWAGEPMLTKGRPRISKCPVMQELETKWPDFSSIKSTLKRRLRSSNVSWHTGLTSLAWQPFNCLTIAVLKVWLDLNFLSPSSVSLGILSTMQIRPFWCSTDTIKTETTGWIIANFADFWYQMTKFWLIYWLVAAFCPTASLLKHRKFSKDFCGHTSVWSRLTSICASDWQGVVGPKTGLSTKFTTFSTMNAKDTSAFTTSKNS